MSVLGVLLFIVGLAVLVLLAKWLIKILIKPAIHVLKEMFKGKK